MRSFGFFEYAAARHTETWRYTDTGIHREMLQDVQRTEDFRQAIQRLVTQGMTVLDIGCGSGILTYFAIQAGAEHVYAVEGSNIADTAQELFERNGIADRVTLLRGLSTEIELPKRADLLVTETLGHLGFDEGILELTADARKRHLEANAPMIPNDTTLIAVPVFCPAFDREVGHYWATKPYGYDTAPMERQAYAAAYITSFAAFEQLGDPQAIARWVLGDEVQNAMQCKGELSVTRTGQVTGIATWFTSQLCQGVKLDAYRCSHWRPVYFPLVHAQSVRQGDTLPVAFELLEQGTRLIQP